MYRKITSAEVDCVLFMLKPACQNTALELDKFCKFFVFALDSCTYFWHKQLISRVPDKTILYCLFWT